VDRERHHLGRRLTPAPSIVFLPEAEPHHEPRSVRASAIVRDSLKRRKKLLSSRALSQARSREPDQRLEKEKL